MSLQSLKNLAPGMPRLMLLPVGEITRCPDCGTFYRATERYWCSQSEGMETYAASCPVVECQDARGGRL
jgi:hypothetical protein